jgi:tetratricopeptide (TPR) repeat protein
VRRAALVFLLLAASGGCAPRAADPAATAAAGEPGVPLDRILEHGCYRCLEAAFPTLRDDAAFQVAVLLTLRAKELGLPYQQWLDRADALMPVGGEWLLYRDIANLVRVDPQSGDREVILVLTTQQRRPVATVLEWIQALQSGDASPIFRAYLELTLACSVGQRPDALARIEPLFGELPLIQYRIGTCASSSRLAALRAAHPDYVDADFPLGRNALESATPDQEEALRLFRSARTAFPESPLILASMADVHRDREEWAQALEAYDAALALVPTHRDALMGRTVALSNLSRHDEAIATATRILELGNWFEGGAYFWRAWNLYHLGNIPGAREDVEQARTRTRSAATLVLAGMIEWRQQQVEAAEKDFQAALDIDRGQCEAAALQGGVRTALERWAEAVESFQHAIQCFDLTIAVRRKLIADIDAGPGSEAGKAGQRARHERAIAEAEKNRGDAVDNAAIVQKRLARAGP